MKDDLEARQRDVKRSREEDEEEEVEVADAWTAILTIRTRTTKTDWSNSFSSSAGFCYVTI